MAAVRGARLSLGAEVALSFACGLAFFAILSVPLAVADSRLLPAAVLGVAAVGTVIAILRLLGVAYAVNAAIAGLLAFDWFYAPPTQPHHFPDAERLADLLVFLAVGALIGVLAASAGRRAATSERARSELAGEQAALRRVATLVAEGVAGPRLLSAVAEEAGTHLGVDGAWIEFYQGEDVVTAAEWSRPGKDPPTFDRVKVADAPVAAAVRRSGRVVRIDDFEDIQPTTVFAEKPRVMSLVGAPITIERGQWGLMLAWSRDAPLPDDAEAQLTAFTELVATAIANSDARAEVSRLADQQAALRRVATLVARGVSPEELFTTVANEVAGVLGVENVHLARSEGDGTITVIAYGGSHVPSRPVGSRMPIDGKSVTGLVLQTERAARIDDYTTATGYMGELAKEQGIHGAVGCPIVVEGRVWGAVVVATRGEEPLPADSESRIGEFTELMATAIANAQARREIKTLAGEQAALRRVATLIAEGAPSPEVFTAVTRELGQLLGVDSTHLARYEPDDTATGVGGWRAGGVDVSVGIRIPLDNTTVTGLVYESGQSARLDDYGQAANEIAELRKDLGIRSSVGAPITVGGEPWGVMIASSNHPEPLPADTEARIVAFSELVATAISNTQARSDLAASRARIVAATDDERRRVVRDLHDGAQQRLVHTVVKLKMASRALEHESDEASPLVAEALQHAKEATDELRELSHGILPSVLTQGGLRAGVSALASRMTLPVETGVAVDRLPPSVEATAYFIVAEALTNVAKHSGASHAVVTARTGNGTLHIQVRDDGVGGAQAEGPGLVGLADRVAALEGTFRLESAADDGTLVAADIPVR